MRPEPFSKPPRTPVAVLAGRCHIDDIQLELVLAARREGRKLELHLQLNGVGEVPTASILSSFRKSIASFPSRFRAAKEMWRAKVEGVFAHPAGRTNGASL